MVKFLGVLTFLTFIVFNNKWWDKKKKKKKGRMCPLPAKENRCITPEQIMVKSEIEFGLPFIVPDLVYKFQMICFRGNKNGDTEVSAHDTFLE